MTEPKTKTINSLACLIVLAVFAGCSGREAAAVDEAPFRLAIERYLRTNDMALAIKSIKSGPTVEGDTARLSASMTHEELGGPSVTWEFKFAKQADGKWLVSGHQD